MHNSLYERYILCGDLTNVLGGARYFLGRYKITKLGYLPNFSGVWAKKLNMKKFPEVDYELSVPYKNKRI